MGNDYLALPRDPQPWVIKNLIPVGGLTNIYGKPKTGKSFAALGMAEAISTDKKQWLNFPVIKHGPVAYLQIDTPRETWAERLADARDGGHDVSKIAFADMLMGPYPYNVLDPAHQSWLAAEIAALQPVVVFIDTLREAHNGDENDSTVMRNVIGNLVSAAQWKTPDGLRGAAVVLISHARKDTMWTASGGDDLMSDSRGSSYVAGRMDMVIKFNPKSMQYQGRSIGLSRLTIQQHEETGMIEMDPEAEAYVQLLERRVRELRSENPKISVNAMATILAGDPAKGLPAETTYKKKRSINDDIRSLLLTKK